mmetsp:Transcript_61571/g.150720  ORF Transcript_61571/g.150720 Transcript_61571/m.150720 type:complete len:355 (+) Transcript_61571:88-1152(+)
MNDKFTAEYGGSGGGAPFMWPQQVAPVVPPSPTIASVAAMQATNTNSNSSSTSNLGIFPYRLHQILADAENDGLDHVISWVAGGTLFKVHSPDSFSKLIMNRYFRHDRYKSFLRQLSMYKFVRVTDGPFRGAYGHPQFLKDRIELSRNISRGDKDEDQQGQSPKTTKTVTKKTPSKTKKMPLPPSPSMKTTTGSSTTISGGGFALSSGMDVTKPYHQNPVTHYYERPSSFGESLPVSSQSSIRNTTLAYHDATATTGFNPSLMNGFGGVDGSASSSSIITPDILDEIISTFGGGSASVSVCDTTTSTRSHSNSFSSATQMDESFTTTTDAAMNLPTVPVAVPDFYHGSNASVPY